MKHSGTHNNVNIKMKKYRDFPEPLYFVVANRDILQTDLDSFTHAKNNPLAVSVSLLTTTAFQTVMQKKKVYPNPLHGGKDIDNK